jgi:hypothetical protein
MTWIGYIEDVPGDGTCLFHAIGKFFNLGGHNLRRATADFISNNLDLKMHDQTLRDWIQWDYDKPAENYAIDLKNGTWGGALEITVIASLLKVPIYVYVRSANGKVKRISDSKPENLFPSFAVNHSHKFICLLYERKSHYMMIHARQT